MNMLKRFVSIGICSFVFAALSAHAEEKNGLSVNVSKVTLEKNAGHASTSSYSSYQRLNRTQGLKVTIKNTSFKPAPEGELSWKIVVVGSYSSQLYTGLEKVKALKLAEAVELVIGSAEVSGWRDGSSKTQDKIEWQLTVKQGSTEILKTQTIPNFDAVAKRAYSADYKNSGGGGKGNN